MPTLDQTVDELLSLAAARFKVPRETLSAGDDIRQKLGIDSLTALDLVTRVENHFGVELPDYEVQNAFDFQTLATLIQSRR